MSIGDLEIWFLEHTFERFSHWWQRNICGTEDCFFLARIAGILFGVAYAQSIHSLAGIIIGCLVAAVNLRLIGIEERRTWSVMKRGCANPSKLEGQFLRYFYLIAAMFLSTAVLFSARFTATFLLMVLLWISVPYFANCDPLPPAKSKVRKWLEKLSQKIKEFFSPAPEQAPVPISVPSRYR